MKLTFPSQFLTSIAVILSSGSFLSSSLQAAEFSETAIDQSQVIAIARPYGEGKYDLLVIEQIPKKKVCWSESGSNPVVVTPLLLNFDFTGHCRRSTDSNGYSVRIDGTDYGLDYLLRLVPRGSELVLIASPRNLKLPELTVGETKGMAAGFMKIILNPGWQFTKRTYNGKQLGHFYFSGSQANMMIAPSGSSSGSPSPSSTIEPAVPAPLPSSTVEPVVPTPLPSSTVEPVVPAPMPSSTVEPAAPAPMPSSTVEPVVPTPLPSSTVEPVVPAPMPSATVEPFVPAPMPSATVEPFVPAPLPSPSSNNPVTMPNNRLSNPTTPNPSTPPKKPAPTVDKFRQPY